MRRIVCSLMSIAALAMSVPVLADEAGALEANNAWHVFDTSRIENPVFITIRQTGNHWVIDGMYNGAPRLMRTQDVELFMASRDLQQWKNAYTDMIVNCDDFEVRESDDQSVCTSRFGEKKVGRAVLGVFFGGTGKVAYGYNTDKVAAAIHSIRPDEALQKLTAFEKGAN